MSQLKASVTIDLNGNLPQQSRRFQKDIEKMTSSGAARLAIMGRSVATVSNQIDRMGNRAILGGGVLGVVFKRSFIDTAAQFEKFAIQLEQLEGSAEKGKKAMAWVSDFAVRTPLEIDEVTEAYAKLRTFGIDPTNGTLQALVDQNAKMAGSSANLEGIILAVGQAWTKQKLQAEEANQLLERNVPVWALLEKATGKSSAQLMKMSERGKLGRKEIQLLIEEIGKSSAGSADKFAQTWEGKISNLNDAWTRWKLQVMDAGTFDFLKGEIDGLLREINRLNTEGQLSDSAKETSANIVAGLKAAKEAGAGLWEVMKMIGDAAKFVADRVAGFENLAKGLAYLYIANKAMRVGAGAYSTIRDAIGGTGGKSGNPLLEAATKGRPIPVYVVNSGNGLAGGNLPDAAAKAGKDSMLLKGALAVGGVVGAGYLGWQVGTKISQKIEGTKASDRIGEAVAIALALAGNKEARASLEQQRRFERGEGPTKIEVEVKTDQSRNTKVKVSGDKGVDVFQSGRVMGTL